VLAPLAGLQVCLDGGPLLGGELLIKER